MRNKGCVGHAHQVSEFEMRCFPSGISNALDALQWSGANEEMQKMYDNNKQMTLDNGKLALRWPNVMMRTPITFKGIRNQQLWKKGDSASLDRVMQLIEKNAGTFKKDLQALKKGGHFEPAYGHLLGAGTWSRCALYDDQKWNLPLCKVAPRICKLLDGELPGRKSGLPYAVGNHEEVTIFHLSPGSHVLPHNGGQNGRVTIHLGLEGFEGSVLKVYTNISESIDLEWSGKETIAFADGWTHEFVNGPGDSYVLAVGVMHPDIDGASYAEAFNGKTMAKTFKDGELDEFKELKTKKQAERRAKKELAKMQKEQAAFEEEQTRKRVEKAMSMPTKEERMREMAKERTRQENRKKELEEIEVKRQERNKKKKERQQQDEQIMKDQKAEEAERQNHKKRMAKKREKRQKEGQAAGEEVEEPMERRGPKNYKEKMEKLREMERKRAASEELRKKKEEEMLAKRESINQERQAAAEL
jgi:hypothetical protein